MQAKKHATGNKKELRYFHDLTVAKGFSREYTSELVQKLSEENPHIPPWVFSSSLGAMRSELKDEVYISFDRGVLVWVKNPDHRIKYLGSSLTSDPEDIVDRYNTTPALKLNFDHLVEVNPHQPPWTFVHTTIEQFENRLIAAFNEGEIVWVKNPDDRKDFFISKVSPDSDKMSWGTKLFLGLWLIGLYYTVNVSFENVYGWEFIIKGAWVLLTIIVVVGAAAQVGYRKS